MKYRNRRLLSACFAAAAGVLALLLLGTSVDSSQHVWRFDPDVPHAIELSPPVAEALGGLAWRGRHWPVKATSEERKADTQEGKALIAPLMDSPEVTAEEKITLLAWVGSASATTKREWFQWLLAEAEKDTLAPEWQSTALRLLVENSRKLVAPILKGDDFTEAHSRIRKKLWEMCSRLAEKEPAEGFYQLAAMASALVGVTYPDDAGAGLSANEVAELYARLMARVASYNKAKYNRALLDPPYLYFVESVEDLPRGDCTFYQVGWSYHLIRSIYWLIDEAVKREDLPALSTLAKMQEKLAAATPPDLVALITAGNGLSRVLRKVGPNLVSQQKRARAEELKDDVMTPVSRYGKAETERFQRSKWWYILTSRFLPPPDTRTLALRYADALKNVQSETLAVTAEAVQFVEELTPEDFREP